MFVAAQGLSVVAACRASSLVGVCRLLRAVAFVTEHTGFVAAQHVGSSWTRKRTCVHCAGRQILYHWGTTRASPRPNLEFLTMMATFLHEVPRALNVPRLVHTSERSTPPGSEHLKSVL